MAANRKDQLQSYQFMVQRVVSALVLRETDPPQNPLRRMGGSAFAGAMVTLIALAAVGVWAMINPGGAKRWQDGGAIIMEKESGTRYVYVEDDDGVKRLHQVENYSSAVLIVGTTEVKGVSANSLAGVPRGPRLGIPDAPDSLPNPKKRLLKAPWTLCSQPGRDLSGGEVTRTILLVGKNPPAGSAVDDNALLVKDHDKGTLHLIWRSHQYPISKPDVVLEALSLRTQTPVDVGTAWLNALPAGAAIGPLPVSGRGGAVPGAGQLKAGDAVEVKAPDRTQYYLATTGGLRPLTELEFLVQRADKAPLRTVDVAAAAAAPKVGVPDRTDEDAPDRAPRLAAVSTVEPTTCASFKNASSAPAVTVGGKIAGVKDGVDTRLRTQGGTVLADVVMVRPGWGAIVEAVESADSPQGTICVVTDNGMRYPVASRAILGALGYDSVEPLRLPASLVARAEAGPGMDPDVARQVLETA